MTEPEQQEIVKRLRRVDNLYSAPMCREAADLIETLTRERDEARRDAKALLILEARYPQRVAQAREAVDAALSSLTPGGEG